MKRKKDGNNRGASQARPMLEKNLRVEAGKGSNVYAEARDAGHKTARHKQIMFIAASIFVLVFAFGLIAPKAMLDFGQYYSGTGEGYSLAIFIQQLQANFSTLAGAIYGDPQALTVTTSNIVRYLVIGMSGAGMALCGAVYQGTFRNALVTPSTLGVMSGAVLGTMLYVAIFVTDEGKNLLLYTGEQTLSSPTSTIEYLIASYGLAIASFLGCLLVVGLVLTMFRLSRGAKVSAIMMIIVGQIIGGISGAISNTIRYYYVATDPEGVKASLLTQLQIASFYRNFTVVDILAVGIPIALVFYVIMHNRTKMMILTFSEGEARSMGVDAGPFRYLVIGLCTLLTAIIVSFCGHIGFVGFLVPHVARRLVGPDLKYLLPAAAVMGAVFVLAAYVLVQITLGPSYETMAGMYISIFGATIFLFTAIKQGKGVNRGRF